MLKKSHLLSLSLIIAPYTLSATPNLNIFWQNENSGQFNSVEKAIINSAITDWENFLHVPIPRTLSLTFNAVYISDALGQAYNANWDHLGNPTQSLIEISTAFDFFLDPTPNSQTEFINPTTNYTYDAQPGSPAYQEYDLRSVVLHEIGHAIGFNGSYPMLDATLNPNTPQNPIHLNTQTLNFQDFAHLDHDTDLMGSPGFGLSQRANISSINRQFLNQFFDYNNTQYFSVTNPNRSINDTATDGVNYTYYDLQFVDNHFNVQDVDIAIHLEHDYIEEMEVSLISPDGTEVLLFSNDYFNSTSQEWTRFDDEVDDSLNIATAQFYYSQMQPRGLLSDFDGEDAYGQWQIKIVDLVDQDQGFFHNATLILTDQDILADFNDDNQLNELDLKLITDNFGSLSAIDINQDAHTGLTELFAFRNAIQMQNLINAIPEPASLLFLISTAGLCIKRPQLA